MHHPRPCCAAHTAQIKLNALLGAEMGVAVLQHLPLHYNMIIISVT